MNHTTSATSSIRTGLLRAAYAATAIAVWCSWAAPCQAIIVSTAILEPANVGTGTLAVDVDGLGGEVDTVNFIPDSSAASILAQYNSLGGTIQVAPYVVGGASRGAGQNIHIDGYGVGGSPSGNLYFRGEPDVPNNGFGAHANWLVTLDLDVIRANHFGNAPGDFLLAGRFGTWGGIGDAAATSGVIQGAIFADGVRIDSMGQSIANPVPVSQSFSLVAYSPRFLTFGIFNGNDPTNNTVWDDGLFQNVTLTLIPVPEPSSLTLLSLSLLGWMAHRRRSRSWRQ
jgi:hypothetical protein